jgi:hypothetical protein
MTSRIATLGRPRPKFSTANHPKYANGETTKTSGSQYHRTASCHIATPTFDSWRPWTASRLNARPTFVRLATLRKTSHPRRFRAIVYTQSPSPIHQPNNPFIRPPSSILNPSPGQSEAYENRTTVRNECEKFVKFVSTSSFLICVHLSSSVVKPLPPQPATMGGNSRCRKDKQRLDAFVI